MFSGGGVKPEIFSVHSTNSIEGKGQRKRGTESGSPKSGVTLNLEMNKARIQITL
jgi:hypothetical protein